MSISKRRSSRLSATFQCAAGLAVVMGLSLASYAVSISLSASDTGQGNPLGTWASQPQNPNKSLWLTKSVHPSPDGVFWPWASVGYLKFDISNVAIAKNVKVKQAQVIFHIKANKASAEAGYIDLLQIKPEAADWHAADASPSLTWGKTGQYYGDKVGTSSKLTLPKAGSPLRVVIPLDAKLVEGWVNGSIANRGLEIWFRPTGDNGGGLNLMGPDTPGDAPVLRMELADSRPAQSAKTSSLDQPVIANPDVVIDPFLNDQYNYFRLGPPPSLRLKIDIKADQGDCQASLVVADYWNHALHEQTQPLSLTPGAHQLQLSPGVDQEGYYELRVKLTREGKPIAAQRLPFVLLSKENDPYTGAASGFGVTSHLDKWKLRWKDPTPMSDTLTIQKLGGMVWTRVDQGSGQIPWAKAVDEAGLQPLSIIVYQWNYDQWVDPLAPDSPEIRKWEGKGVPKELSSFAEHVYQTVTKHKDQVHAWELGNEPQYWKVLPEDYAQLAKAGAIAAKLADPNCTVILGDQVFLYDPVLRTGVSRECDAVAIHIYGYFKPYFWGMPTRMMNVFRTLHEYGLERKPLWITETGGNGYGAHIQPGLTLREVYHYQALDLPKKLAGGRAAGAEKVLIYNMRDKPVKGLEQEFGVVHGNRTPKPAFMAYRTTARLLARSTPLGAIELDDNRFQAYAFNTPDGKTAIFWRNDDAGELGHPAAPLPAVHTPVLLKFKAASPVTSYDIMGSSRTLRPQDGRIEVPVNEYPVFVVGDVDYNINADYGHATPTPTEKHRLPPVIVRIFPGEHTQLNARELMYGRRVTLKKGVKQRVMVRVYNTGDQAVTGQVILHPPEYFTDNGWIVHPVVSRLAIPPNGMKTAVFDVEIPPQRGGLKGEGYLLRATFAAGGGLYSDQAIVTQAKR